MSLIRLRRMRQLVYDWGMRLIMNDENLQTIGQVKQFLDGSEGVEFRGQTVEEKYDWIERVLVRFKYNRLKRVEKGVVRRYIEKVSGYSRAQVSRLIGEYKRRGRLKRAQYRRHRFPRRYTPSDIGLLARTDELHDYLSGPATKKIMEREYALYGPPLADQEHLSNIYCPFIQSTKKSHLPRYNQTIHQDQTSGSGDWRAVKTGSQGEAWLYSNPPKADHPSRGSEW